MTHERNDEQERLLDGLRSRVAAGQIDRRGFLTLALAAGIGSAFAQSLADQVLAGPGPLRHGKPTIEACYDYIVIGAGSAGCAIAARLSEDPACSVLLIEAGGDDISRPALESPVLWPSNFGTD